MSSKGTDHGARSHSGLATSPSIVGGVGQKGATYARGWRDQCGSSGSGDGTGDGTGGGTGGGTGAAAGPSAATAVAAMAAGMRRRDGGNICRADTRWGRREEARAAAVQSGSGLRGKDQI